MLLWGSCLSATVKEERIGNESGASEKNRIKAFCVVYRFYGQATKGVCVDALAQVGDEGRGQLR